MKHTSFFTCMGYVALVLMLLMGLSGCSGEKYKVEYDSKGAYVNAKDYYRAGSKVVLYYDLIATDTDYSFLLDGEHISFTYDEKKGFVIEFVMPEHDVNLECRQVNSMLPMETYEEECAN